jgi:monoamine oxidase
MDPFARGSYAGWLRGQYTRFAGYERVRQGNVLFAGEHCSVLLQGFMEGAAREGARAAREVLADIGMRATA